MDRTRSERRDATDRAMTVPAKSPCRKREAFVSAETAQTVLVAIAAVGAVVWLVGLWFLAGSYKAGTTVPDPMTDPFADIERQGANWLLGNVELNGQPAALKESAASRLTKASSGCLRIVEQSGNRVAFERVGPLLGGLPERGELRFSSPASNRTRIDYAVEIQGRRWLLRVGALFQVLGLVALVGGYWALQEFCVPSPNPDIRTQAVQMVQAIHFLWPPFLFGGLYRRTRKATRDAFETLLYSLPQYQS